MALMFARQPIFNEKNDLYGYELLYREEGGTTYNSDDGDMATSSVMAAGFLSMGVSQITGEKKAFINFTENMLLHGVATLFPKEQIVVEILEDVEPTQELIEACKCLKKEGYIIALDDFIFRPGYEALVELADIIKIDFMLTKSEYDRQYVVKRFKNGRIKFLAEKIETFADFKMAVKAGYSLFQGYYFSKPIVESTTGVPPSKINHISLINTLQNTDPEFKEIAGIIEKDVAFTYEILRIANTVHYYRGKEITSVRQAVLRMGLDELKKWALITVLRKLSGEGQDAVVTLCVQRAKALELLCGKAGLSKRKLEFYTLGILSMIDVLTGCSMETVLMGLSISEETKQVLLGALDKGAMSSYYKLVLSYEKGEWSSMQYYAEECSMSTEDISKAYFEALVWVNSFKIN